MNKVWNASRFIMMNLDKADIPETMPENLSMADRWILSKVNNLVTDVTRNMEAFDLGIALDKVQNFIWEEFCDWYIEMVKPRLWNEEDETKGAALWTLKHVLITSLKLLHPFCPFITEEIYDTLTDSSSPLMRQEWPSYDKALDFSEDEAEIEAIKEAVRAIRNIRTEMNVAPSRKAQNYVVTTNDRVRKTFEHSKVFFATLAYASEVFIQEDKNGIADDAVSVAIPDAVIYIPFADLVDIEKEKERLLKEKAKWEAEIKRSEGMLNNERFISKAPEAKVQEERAKLEKNKQMLKQVTDRLEALH